MARVENSPLRSYSKSRLASSGHSAHSSPDRLISGSHHANASSAVNSYGYGSSSMTAGGNLAAGDDLLCDQLMDDRPPRSTSLLHNSHRSRSAGRLAGASSSILAGGSGSHQSRYHSASTSNFDHDRDYLHMRNDRGAVFGSGPSSLHYDPHQGVGTSGGMLSHRDHRSNPAVYYDEDLYGGGGTMGSSSRHQYRNLGSASHHDSSLLSELQHQNTELQRELAILKKELELTGQKLGSSMHSIKTFWSPELKKERALRKEEGAKYSLINDQLKLLNAENQKQAILVRQLEDELRLRMRTPSLEVQQQIEVMYQENEHLTREISILRDTIKELEIRIETHKQTLQSRDETVMKLLEALQNKGMGKEEERQMFQQMQQMAQKQLDEFRIEIQRRDQEILAMGAKMKTLEEQNQDYQRHISVLKESLCAKEEHYNLLQTDMEDLRQRLDDKNRQIDKKSTLSTQINQELSSLKEHMEIKDRKINVLQRKIENMEELLKEKENQVDMARARLMAMQSHKCTSDGAVSTLEETIGDKEKQIMQLREQKDRLEHEKLMVRENYEKDLQEIKERYERSNSELRKLQLEKDTYAHEAKNYVAQTEKLRAEMIQLQKDRDHISNELDKAQMFQNQVQKERDRIADELDAFKKKIELQTSQTLKAQREKTELETELEVFKERFEKANSAQQKFLTEKDALNTELTIAKEKLDKANYNVQKIADEKDSIAREYEKLLDKYDRCQTEKHRLDMELEKKNQLNATRFRDEEEFEKMKERVEMAISARDSVELEAGRLAKELEKAQIQMARAIEEREALQLRIEQMQQECARFVSEQQRADLAEKAAIELQKKLQAVEKQLYSQQNQYQALHQQFQQYQRSATSSTDELSRLRNEVKVLMVDKTRLQQQLDELLAEIETMQREDQQQQSSTEELAQMQRQIDQQMKQLEEQQRRLQSRANELEAREQSVQEVEAAMAQKERSLQERERNVREQTQQLRVHEEQLQQAEIKFNNEMTSMASASSANNSGVSGAELDKLRNELEKYKEENRRINTETERLLKLMQLSQEEQNTKERQISNMQQTIKQLQTKLAAQPQTPAPSVAGIDTKMHPPNNTMITNNIKASNNTKPPQYLSMEDQQLYLESLINVVKSHAFQMKVSLDKNKIMDGLKSASGMISELRTTLLSPKNYYELYMKVTDELQHLQIFLVEELRKGMNDSNLYEVVQYAGNIVPRLYLLVTVGLAYIKNNVSLRREILKDLVEMCRGVQHPLKGLFLRSYLLQCSRNVLPDVPITENENEGTVYDSIDFVLVNFGEMNKLWVRMQHQGHSRDKDRLENERKELRILVGTNLVRLSQLESITVETYSKVVLPGILEQVVSCRDAIAQDYLMECIIQVFPDEFHLKTLSVYLKTCAELKQGVNIKNIIICLMNRLASYNQRQTKMNKTAVTTVSTSLAAKTDSSVSVPKVNILDSNSDTSDVLDNDDHDGEQRQNGDVNAAEVASDFISGRAAYATTKNAIGLEGEVEEEGDVELFEIFSDHIAHIVQMRKMSTDEIIALKVALMNLAQKSYPDRIDYIDKVMLATINVLDQLNIDELVSNKPISRELTKLMKLPIDHYNDVLKIVELQHFSKLLKYFDKTGQKNLGIYLITNALEHQTFVRKKDQVVKIFDILESLTNVQIDIGETNDSYDQETLIDEQLLLARFLYYLRTDDLDEQFDILTICQNCLMSSNAADSLRYTIPPIVFAYYELALLYKQNELQYENWNQKCHSIFKNCHSIVNSLLKYDLFELPLRLFLQGALTISKIKFDDYESLAYEFVSQAFSIYEDEISESKAQLSAISLIIGTLEQLECFGEENAEPLRTQCALAGAKLLKKPDQCRAAIVCSHLFWSSKNYATEIRDEKRVTERLIKAYNIAKQCLNNLVQVQLFTEILNHYIYFYERGCEKITVDMINELIIKLKSITVTLDNSEESEQILKHFSNTLDYIRSRIETNEGLLL